MKVLTLQTGVMGVNTYIVGTRPGAGCAVIDPGGNVDAIMGDCDCENWRITHILLTHGHFDHIGGVKALRAATEGKVYIHPDDAPKLMDADLNLSASVGLPTTQCEADFWIRDGDEIILDCFTLKVLHTPGHSAGGVCFYTPGMVFSGDTLMKLSIGRTDFADGDLRQILRSIREKLMPLPDETVVFPGHGGASTMEYEKHCNTYMPLAK